MHIKDQIKYKKLFEIKELAKITKLSPANLLKLVETNKIPAVKIHNKFYCSCELLDQGLLSLSKTELLLLSGQVRGYVYRLTPVDSYLGEALNNIEPLESEEVVSVDPEDGIIAEWLGTIEKKYNEIINEIARNKRFKRSIFRKFILQLKEAVFFTSNKLESAKNQTLEQLSPRTYAVELIVGSIFVLIISIGLVRFYPGFTNLIVKANDKIFYNQVDFIEKNLILNLSPEFASIKSNILIPDKKQLTEFIKNNSNKLIPANSGKDNKYIITADEIFGRVAGALEKK